MKPPTPLRSIHGIKALEPDDVEGYVYFLTLDDEVVYVGSTRYPPFVRVRDHKNRGLAFDNVFYIEVAAEDRFEIEADYIDRFHPRYNSTTPSGPAGGGRSISRTQRWRDADTDDAPDLDLDLDPDLAY